MSDFLSANGMFTRDIPKLPLEFSREEYVGYVIKLGYLNNISYDTILTAVYIGDKVVNWDKSWKICHWIKSTDQKIISLPMQRIYSKELAIICLIIICKIKEDEFNYTQGIVNDYDNCYLYKMEWEICMNFNFEFPIHNSLTEVAAFYERKVKDFNESKSFCNFLVRLLKMLSANEISYKFSHNLVLMSLILLSRNDKITITNFDYGYKRAYFDRLIKIIRRETGASKINIYKSLIKLKSGD